METSTTNRQFLLDQIKEIQIYLLQFPTENPEHVIIRWIETGAQTYRVLWEAKHYNEAY